jgi:hypothetical protein
MAAALRTYPYPSLYSLWRLEGSYDTDLQGLYPQHVALLTRFLAAAEGRAAQTRLFQLGAVDRVLALHARGFEGLRPIAEFASLFRGSVHVFAVDGSVPRTYVATRAREAEGMAALDAILSPDFRLQDDVVLSRGPVITPPRVAAPPSAASTPRGWSRIVSWQPDAVRLEAEAPAGGGWLVLVDTFDRGWRAAVDGRPAEVVRANVAFRAVPLTAGRHVVEFVYRPPSVAWGLGISAVTLVGLAAAWVRERRPPVQIESPAGERYDPSRSRKP